jgi:hypothetical protein
LDLTHSQFRGTGASSLPGERQESQRRYKKSRHEEKINEKKGELSDQKDHIHNTTSLAMAIYPTEQTAYASLLAARSLLRAVTFLFQSLIISVHFSIRQKKGCYGNHKITY